MSTLAVKGNSLMLDGNKFVVVSGAIHYFRVIPEYWEDRLKKLKACGFNCVETYVCWNLHERQEGKFDFDGRLDLERFIRLAAKWGLYVILRPGPYICAEWEMGGLPSWLLGYKNLHLRCNNDLFLEKVQAFFRELFSRLNPYLCTNGGNILAVQVENEYGSYGDDKQYLDRLKRIIEDCGVDCLLFTADGTADFMLGGGLIDGVLATANFGTKVKWNFSQMEKYRPHQPLFCMEYWNGWFDHWYEDHHTREADDTAAVLDELLSTGASVNFYMFHGGTNFGFTNGANYQDVYMPTVTSYDYHCPVSECGDITPKYYEVKRIIEKHFGKAPDIPVGNLPKKAYGYVTLDKKAYLFDSLDLLSSPEKSTLPMTMEQLHQDFGYILYSTMLEGPFEELPITADGLHDRALFFIDGKLKGVQQRDHRQESKPYFSLEANRTARLDILVENMGRVNYGTKIWDQKGILNGVLIGQRYHFGWENYSLPMEDLSKLTYMPIGESKGESTPVFLTGSFTVTEAEDTFIRLDGFTKGFVLVNGFNIGRYWNAAGPQRTLYVPGPLLKAGENTLTVFESDSCSAYRVLLTDQADLG